MATKFRNFFGKRWKFIGTAFSSRKASDIANIAEGRSENYVGYDQYHGKLGYTNTHIKAEKDGKYSVWGRLECNHCHTLLDPKSPEVQRGWRLCKKCRNKK